VRTSYLEVTFRLGIEITAPGKVSATALNRVLTPLGASRVSRTELAPLLAA